MNTRNVLITQPSSKLGCGVVNAFLLTDNEKEEGQLKYRIFGTSKDGKDSSLRTKGVNPIKFQFGSQNSIQNALKVSQASVVVIITGDQYDWGRKNGQDEFEQAKVIIDACTSSASQIDHLFFLSAFACDEVPKTFESFEVKHKIEHYLYQQMNVCRPGFHYDIIRPAVLLDMMNWGFPTLSLNQGKLINIFAADASIPSVASIDVGRAVISMLNDPDTWGTGQILHAISCIVTGNECAKAYSDASGEYCKYKECQPLSLRLMSLRPMAKFFNVGSGHAFERQNEWREEFLEVVPNAIGPTEFFFEGMKAGDKIPSNPLMGIVKIGKKLKIANENEEPKFGVMGAPTDYAEVRTP